MARVRVQVPVDQLPASHQPHAALHEHAHPQPLLTKNRLAVGVAVLFLIVVVLLVSVMNDRNKLKQQVDNLATPGQAANTDQTAQRYNEEVGKLVEVPSGVSPAVKTPTQAELEQLKKGNSLYNSAQVGDAFLIYTKSDKSLFLVIYRPTSHKIILAAESRQEPAQTTQP